jgi:phage-related protein
MWKNRLTLFAKLRTIEEGRLPPTEVVFYQEDDGSVPLMEWLDRLPAKAQAKCVARLKRLEDLGHELRRPEADYLRDGIHELRASLGGVHYRILYFFHGNIAAVVSHGITKEQRVPPREIERAIDRKNRFTTDPARYTFQPELS